MCYVYISLDFIYCAFLLSLFGESMFYKQVRDTRLYIRVKSLVFNCRWCWSQVIMEYGENAGLYFIDKNY